MKIRLAAYLQPDSIVDGEGVRTVVWTQGCPHHCPGCHNASTWDFNDGALIDVEDVITELKKIKNQDGITLSGGDPVCQAEACYEISKAAHSMGLNVWCYTGFTYEQMLLNPKARKLLEQIDVLVDGKFVQEEKSYDIYFRGSRNQRIIDVPKSLETEQVVLVEKYMKDKSYNEIYQKPDYLFI
ncbi:MAG: anaerobic ribonucleoside-triphosphate reductase activating protein [bacterium]|nr:anaerobic ribonucleoside-triphosphate reductase activating protein [Mycoplasmatota bacterium]MDD6757598.1 anaerobic ribonucleoside-triphosphate reductase activating protein [bacterium]MDY2907787.1 anaerobic ribonucleoside-triphosphate reductase activating protein [Candidatus Faecimonas sp.]